MVKKSPRDLYKDDLSRYAKKKRQALKGPFRCPKCLTAKALHYQAKTGVVKETYFNEWLGEEVMRLKRQTTYLFSCRACKYRTLVVSPASSFVIDEYNALYDRELSPVEAQTQRAYVRSDPIRLLRLLKCEVKMR